jgi:hypothetical protein
VTAATNRVVLRWCEQDTALIENGGAEATLLNNQAIWKSTLVVGVRSNLRESRIRPVARERADGAKQSDEDYSCG